MWPPPFLRFFEWVATLPGSLYLREDSPNFFGTFLTLHVLSLCLFLGLVFMMDLRLIGVAHLDTPVSQIQKRLFPWQLFGAIVMAISGFVLDPEGRVRLAVYSTGAIGRLVPEDVVGLVRYLIAHP